jgi:SOS response regulatory protein OraA/RecX
VQLTSKQLEAIFKMEEFAGISSHRENFANHEEFQAYWELLDKKIKKKKSFREAVKQGRVSLDEVRKKRASNIEAYYLDYNHLKTYGEKYCQKYTPSSIKLKKQLTKKCKDVEIVDKVFQALLPQLDDNRLALTMAQNLLRKGKDPFQAKIYLTKKMFSKETIDKVFALLSQERPMEIEDSPLPNQIRSLRKKGKSTREILQKYRNCIYAKEEILAIINETQDEEVLLSEINKLVRKKVDQKKIVQRLIAKGFSYQDIKKNL